MKKQLIIVIVGILLSIILLSAYLMKGAAPKDVLKDKISVSKLPQDFPIQIIPTDTVDGRPVYTVLFSDSTAMDSMYAEEIGASLSTGVWGYDEDIKINR